MNNLERTDPRHAAVARILWIILGLNLAVALTKLAFGQLTGSLAITADGLHSVLDASSNVIGLVGISLAQRPPDENHPYGHRKYETFAAIAVAGMMFLGCRGSLARGWPRLPHPGERPHIPAASFAVLAGTIAVNLIVVVIERREGRRLQSELLRSDAAHTLSDVYASLLVIASFVAQQLHVGW